MHARTALLAALLTCGAATAQTAAQDAPQPVPDAGQALQKSEQIDGRRNQKVERIRIEDGGNTIEETRYGGQTQSITVQPKGDMPAWEVSPTDLARSRPADARDGMGSATGQRVWNFLKF